MNATAGIFPEAADRVDAAVPGRRRLAPLAGLKGRLAMGRACSEQQMLDAIRHCRAVMDLANCSDGELRERLKGIQARLNPADPEGGIVETFAITEESIRRRLGYWRVFEPDFDRQNLEGYWQLAQCSYADPAAAGLDGEERVIVDTLRRVRRELPARYGWDILLPGEFYQALGRKDTDNILRFEPTDEQLLAGIQLFRGKIVEMNAGEGKTVAGVFPAVLHALHGRSVQIATANDYLAARDCELLAPVYRALGISVDNVLSSLVDGERRYAYGQQVVYGTLREFGFDFLRDNLKTAAAEQVQGKRDTIIVDEVDQALIDEARTPLIIAGAPLLNRQTLERANQAVGQMVERQADRAGGYLDRLEGETLTGKAYAGLMARALLAQPDSDRLRQLAAAQPRAYRQALAVLYPDGSDYPDPDLAGDLYCLVDREQRFVTLTAQGVEFLENRLGSFYDAGADGNVAGLSRQEARRMNLANQVYQLLRAYLLLKRDADYIVAEEGIILLDRTTGRPRPDSRYQEGLHPALEAKEGVAVNPEGAALAQISVQGFASGYRHLAGMTGTAVAAAAEFRQLYSREVVALPTAHPLRRRDLPSRVYVNRGEQLAAIAAAARQCQEIGQPVLVGVQTVAESAVVSKHLAEAGIEHNLLNAVSGHREAEIVRWAGAAGAVTVATNMAGRGTDIILEPELNGQIIANCLSLLRQRLERGNCPVVVSCPTAAEANLLAAALAADRGLDCTRRERNRAELVVSRAGGPRSAKSSAVGPEPVEFGLGLYVVSAAFSAATRVAWQLKGRSGRQGQFGATRFMLSWDDPLLAYRGDRRPGLAACQKTDAAGRIYFEGKAVERYLEQVQEAAETDAAAGRGVQQDYAAIADAHTAAYYQARQELMTGATGLEYASSVAPDAAYRIVERHFPGGENSGYSGRFWQLAKELRECYGIDADRLYGAPLDSLPGEIADLLVEILSARHGELGGRRFGELARLLRLQSGDEVWKDYRAGLQARSVSSWLGGYGHKSAVADYIIHAATSWREFQGEWADLFLARLCVFPLEELAREGAADGLPAAQLDERAALLVS